MQLFNTPETILQLENVTTSEIAVALQASELAEVDSFLRARAQRASCSAVIFQLSASLASDEQGGSFASAEVQNSSRFTQIDHSPSGAPRQ